MTSIRKEYAQIQIYGKDSSQDYQPCQVSGSIKKENVRSYEVDKMKMEKCIKPGDIVRALVLTGIESHNIYASLAEDDCGVIFLCCSECNIPMTPVNWHQMLCMHCNKVCERKVAKPLNCGI